MGKIQTRMRTIMFVFIILLIPLNILSQQISNGQQQSKNKCKVFIINNSNSFWYSAGPDIIETKIDNEYYGNILVKDYIEIETETGSRDFIFMRRNIKSVHNVILNPGINYLIVKAKVSSHQIELSSTPPKKFEKRFHKRGEDCESGFLPFSKPLEYRVNNQIRADLSIIQLFMLTGFTYKNDRAYIKWCNDNAVQIDSTAKFRKEIDSTYIRLSNGLSWNTSKGPPQKPLKFVKKLLSKKSRHDPEMNRWFKYLEFCYFLGHQYENVCPIYKKYQIFVTLYVNGKAMFNIQYLFDLDKNAKNRKELLGIKPI
jgi:hypothetical protein